MDREWPLLGRDSHVRLLADLFAKGEHGGAVVGGIAGVGKTRLAREGVRLAEERGFVTAWVTASRSARVVPFGALAPLLPAGQQNPDAGPERLNDLLRGYLAALTDRGANRRFALFVDDAHLLDDLSATLIYQAASSRIAFVLATVRTDEPIPDPVTSLWKEGLAERIELRGLGTDPIADLLTVALGGQIDPAAAAYLTVHCQGNMLFLREIVMGALEDGTLCDRDGVWRLTGPLSPSARLVELVEARLTGLEVAERELIELVSYGEPLGGAEVAELAEPGTVASVERKGLLVSRLEGRRLELRLGHPIYGDVVRDRVSGSRLRAMARALAEVTEARGARRREDTLRVGVWRLDGGGASPQLMLDAAGSAHWRHDIALAGRLARAAVDAGGGFEAAFLVAQLDRLEGRATDAMRQLTALADQVADETQRSRVIVAQLDNLLLSLGSSQECLRVFEAADATMTDPQGREELAARRTGLALATMGPRASVEAAGPMLDEDHPTPEWARFALSFSLGRLGRIDQASAIVRRTPLPYAASVSNEETYAFLHLWLQCEALACGGQLPEAAALATDQYHLAVGEGNVAAQAVFAWCLARSVGLRGDVDTAARQAREAVALFRYVGHETNVRCALVALAMALALGGRGGEASGVLDEIDALPPDPALWTGVDLLEARAWTAVACGDLPGGRQLMQDAAELGDRIGDLIGRAAALHGLARLGHPRDALPALESLAATVEGELVPARAAHTRALAHHDAGGLADAASRFEALGAMLPAAEAATASAAAWRKAGDTLQAVVAERRAAALLEQCEGPKTPALRVQPSAGALTEAEWDTALLAAAGRTSKDIAQTLCLSVRTVENRLQRVYDKLNISGRSDLAAALGSPR